MCLLLRDGFPSNGPPAAADEEAGEGATFKQFKGSACQGNVPELPSPTHVAVTGELMVPGWRRRGGVRVCVAVVVVREVVEGLDGVVGVGLKGNPVFRGTVEVLEGVDGGLVVLMR